MKWSEFNLEIITDSKYEVNSNVFVFESMSENKKDMIKECNRVKTIVFPHKEVELVFIYPDPDQPDIETVRTLSTHYDNVMVVYWPPKGVGYYEIN
jgi:hypothetical protein